MKKNDYLKKKIEIISKSIMIIVLLVITTKIFFYDEYTFLLNLIKGNEMDYCIAHLIQEKLDNEGKNISQENALNNINQIIKNADENLSCQLNGYMQEYGKNVLDNHYSLKYKYVYSKEQNAYLLEIEDYLYLSDGVDNNLLKNGKYIITTIDDIEYIFIKENNKKRVLKSSENPELYNKIVSFGVNSQISKVLNKKGRIKSAKSYKIAQKYIIDFENFRSGVTLYTYGKNKVLSCNIYIHNDEYNYINDMSSQYTDTIINIPKLEDYI